LYFSGEKTELRLGHYVKSMNFRGAKRHRRPFLLSF